MQCYRWDRKCAGAVDCVCVVTVNRELSIHMRDANDRFARTFRDKSSISSSCRTYTTCDCVVLFNITVLARYFSSYVSYPTSNETM